MHAVVPVDTVFAIDAAPSNNDILSFLSSSVADLLMAFTIQKYGVHIAPRGGVVAVSIDG